MRYTAKRPCRMPGCPTLVDRGFCDADRPAPRSALTIRSRKASVQVVAKLAGHSDIATTMRYYLAITDDQIEAVRAAGGTAADADLRRGDPF